MKIVLDTNVFLSGLASPQGIPAKILTAWDNHSFELAMSEFQLAEVSRVLAYPKIRKVLKWDDNQIQNFIRQLCLRVEIVGISDIDVQVPTDPDDSPILASFIASKAEYLVSGGKDLTALRDVYSIETPAEFVVKL